MIMAWRRPAPACATLPPRTRLPHPDRCVFMRSFAFLLACLAVCGAFALMRPRSTAADKQPPSFSRDGVAFLEKHCVHCHNDKKKKADVSLHAFKDDASLLKNRKLGARVA